MEGQEVPGSNRGTRITGGAASAVRNDSGVLFRECSQCCWRKAKKKVVAGPRSPASSQSGMPRVPSVARPRQRARPAWSRARDNPTGGAGPAKSALPRALESY